MKIFLNRIVRVEDRWIETNSSLLYTRGVKNQNFHRHEKSAKVLAKNTQFEIHRMCSQQEMKKNNVFGLSMKQKGIMCGSVRLPQYVSSVHRLNNDFGTISIAVGISMFVRSA